MLYNQKQKGTMDYSQKVKRERNKSLRFILGTTRVERLSALIGLGLMLVFGLVMLLPIFL